MERLIVLGTGNASALRCYNTCFILHDGAEPVLVDAGGGNGVLTQLQRAGIRLESLHHAFLTHCHTDHLFGMIWVLRFIATRMASGAYEGTFTLRCHEELAEMVRAVSHMTLPGSMTRFFGDRIHILPVRDGEKATLGPYPATFFDIGSTKARQFGFTMTLLRDTPGCPPQGGAASQTDPAGKQAIKFTCAGDEPYNEKDYEFVKESDWLMHEAFCLYSEAEEFKPYEKHHSTVREACRTAAELGARNLVLWHTEDSRLAERKALYTAEGREFFSGNLFVPDDLDVIPL